MLSHEEISHYRAFGFVVLRGLLAGDEVARLATEAKTELTEAFGGLGTDPGDEGGIPGDYLPLMVDRAPFSQALVADDPRLFQAAAELGGAPMVPTPALAVCFTGNAGWHTDVGPAVGGVKFLLHLEPRAAETGALRVIPGSHEPGFARRLESYWACDPSRQGFEGWPVPGAVVPTEPGDAIAFDVHLFHSSRGGGKRLAWSVEYLAWPGLGDPSRCEVVRDLIVDAADYSHEGYDLERWPSWGEWRAGAGSSTSRQVALDRLELLGVL